MYTLLIDTHFTKVKLVLYKDNNVDKLIIEESNQSHSIITMPLIEKLLQDANIDVKDINQIVVVNGPGSFTGVRIGVTIAKTIGYCLNIPIKVISSLEVLACNINSTSNKIVAFNDRNGYFVGKFNGENKLIEDYFYLTNTEYAYFKNNNVVYDNITNIDYNEVYKLIVDKDNINPHLANPIYVKKIEVLK